MALYKVASVYFKFTKSCEINGKKRKPWWTTHGQLEFQIWIGWFTTWTSDLAYTTPLGY